MVGQVSGHGRGGAETAVYGTEVVDGARPEHLAAQAVTALRQVAGAESGVQAFDEGGVDAAKSALAERNQLIGALAATVDDPAFDAGQEAPPVLLDDLDDVQIGPGSPRRPARAATTDNRSKNACG